jgi:hypothetical protein
VSEGMEALGDPIVWPVDMNGYLVNLARSRRLQPAYEDCVAAVLRALPAANGAPLCAVYIRGSVALGVGKPPYSDLDLIAVVGDDAFEVPANLRSHLLQQYPLLEDIDIAMVSAAALGHSGFGVKAGSLARPPGSAQ